MAGCKATETAFILSQQRDQVAFTLPFFPPRRALCKHLVSLSFSVWQCFLNKWCSGTVVCCTFSMVFLWCPDSRGIKVVQLRDDIMWLSSLQSLHAWLCRGNDDWCSHGSTNGRMQLLCSFTWYLHGPKRLLAIALHMNILYSPVNQAACHSWLWAFSARLLSSFKHS